jgi:hypothetical protein
MAFSNAAGRQDLAGRVSRLESLERGRTGKQTGRIGREQHSLAWRGGGMSESGCLGEREKGLIQVNMHSEKMTGVVSLHQTEELKRGKVKGGRFGSSEVFPVVQRPLGSPDP